MKLNIAEFNRINEMMSQNIHLSNKQNVNSNSARYTIVETVQRINLMGTHRGIDM